MPVFNGARHIRDALNSLQAQTFGDFEVIISDNASSDDTEAICRSYAENDERICYIRQPENLGAANNFKFVLNMANSQYFKWLAHDDVLHPEFLQKVVSFLDDHPDVVLCSTDYELIEDDGKSLKTVRIKALRNERAWRSAQTAILSWKAIWCESTGASVYGVYRWRDICGCEFPSEGMWGLASASEYPWLVQVALRGRVVTLGETLNTWRSHANSLSASAYNSTFWPKVAANYFYMLFRGVGHVARSDLNICRKTQIMAFQVCIDLPRLVFSTIRVMIRGACRRIWRNL